MMMINSIEFSLQQLISNRLDEITEHLMLTNENYKVLSSQCSQQFRQIQEYIPHDLQAEMLRYEETIMALQSVIENHIYTQGVKDGFNLVSLLK